MEKSDNIILKWMDKKYLKDLSINGLILAIMLFSFWVSMKGEFPNMTIFLVIVILCFVVITLFRAKHIYIGFAMMVIGGFMGYFCDLWGVGSIIVVLSLFM